VIDYCFEQLKQLGIFGNFVLLFGKIVEGIANIKGEKNDNMQSILWDNFLNIISPRNET